MHDSTCRYDTHTTVFPRTTASPDNRQNERTHSHCKRIHILNLEPAAQMHRCFLGARQIESTGALYTHHYAQQQQSELATVCHCLLPSYLHFAFNYAASSTVV